MAQLLGSLVYICGPGINLTTQTWSNCLLFCKQVYSQHQSSGQVIVPPSIILQSSHYFLLIFFIFSLFLSSYLPFWWVSRPPGRAWLDLCLQVNFIISKRWTKLGMEGKAISISRVFSFTISFQKQKEKKYFCPYSKTYSLRVKGGLNLVHYQEFRSL